MYLKTLTLKGFKSFLDRTRLSFDPGLTVVVGPNGSGKSNISDAILWVLGEQSAKTLRGQDMEDVIFAGSAQRHAVGLAEVTLVLDNADGTLPLDFSEISITRRMYRSGESEYLVNGAQVRLRDVRDLLHDAGLGRDTHTIISQGRLGEVLQSRPEDRRALIEEAAGIAKHRQRRERAERKLERLDESILRIRSFARLLKRDLAPLARQVDQARAVGELRERKGLIETTLAVDDLRRLQGSWEALDRRLREAEAAKELGTYRLKEKERELAKVKRLLEEKGLFVGDLDEQRQRSQRDLEAIGAGIKLLEEKGHHLVDRLSDARLQLSQLNLEAVEVERSLSGDSKALEEAQGTLDAANAKLERLQGADAKARSEADEARWALDEARGALNRTQRAHDEATLGLAALDQELSAADTRERLIADRLAELAEERKRSSEALDAAEAAHAKAESARKPLRERSEVLSRELEMREEASLAAARNASDLEARLTRATAELEALDALAEAAGKAEPIQRSLEEALAKAGEAPQRLAQVLSVPESYEEAVAAYLGDDVQAFAASDERTLAELVQRASASDEEGRASFVAPSGAGVGYDGPVHAVRAADEPLVASLFGAVAFGPDVSWGLEQRKRGEKAAYLGADGSVVFADGRVRWGGGRQAVDQALGRNRRRTRLAKQVPELTASLEAAKADAARANDALAASQRELRGVKDELQNLEGELQRTSRDMGHAEEALAHAEASIEALAKEREAAAGELEGRTKRREELKAKAEEAARELAELRAKLPAVEDAERRAVDAAEKVRDDLNATRLSALRAEERHGSLGTSVASLAQRSRTLADRRAQIDLSARSLDLLRRRVDPLHKLMDELHEVALAKATIVRDRSSIAEADSATLKATVARAEDEAREAREELEAANAEAAELQGSANVIEERVRTAAAKVRELGAMDFEQALELPAPKHREHLERELARLVEEIAAVGPVNEAALASYEEAQARLERVQSNLDDLKRAQEALRRISAAVERKMRERYLEAFQAVSGHFTEVFRTLFGGGDARLEMTDAAHPLNAGVEVVAQPPKKRVTKMSLLSGGERALTALALLFAVYRTRTVPFYVFDEVEQALDDTNLNKLLSSLDALKRQTQLIVISHQRRTMEQADVLYGVSMGADGVSRAVSQRLADFKAKDAATA